LTTTAAPSAASDFAMSAPMPFDAPVTTATLLPSLLISLSSGVRSLRCFYNHLIDGGCGEKDSEMFCEVGRPEGKYLHSESKAK
jgi:hypothetical protein